MKLKRADLILIAALLLLGAGLFGLQLLLREPGAEVVITVEGKETARYPIGEDRVVRLEKEGGSYNVLVISGGRADITEAGCPDQICVNAHAIQYEGESIVCLPNQTVISVEGGESSGVDIG